jgi:hypothetical protein
MKKVLIFSIFVLSSIIAFGKNNVMQGDSGKILPKVFLLGEYTAAYEKIHNAHPSSLFEFCNNDADQAFDKWARFLIGMEMYAQSINYDIKGVKVWMEVCWEKDGTLKYIAYAPKPDSRNTDLAELSAFMKSFSSHYTPQFSPGKNIVQNSHASFPFLN